ncbi:MAG: flagellar biosynthesis protein FlhA [Planctomycetota bacterium]|nr:MAG: flagellar biosynthesis protein FlhA [Planctomycetota bacterium]
MSAPRDETPRGDALLAGLAVAILAVLVVPLPQVLLDLLLTGSISFSLLILVTTLKAREPLEFSTFPTILLFATLSRLALNVSSSRLILLEGDAGTVIRAFGQFVVGGNVFVGGVIFLILVVVQFVVITKGASRVSEVAARFTLDAMPGKQMAIDADLNAGHIDEEEARRRRERVAREAEFHGAMDGASKFVRGDAIAGLLITAINIIGGLVVGLGSGMDAAAALQKYAILTVGDGLVSQIPALLISTAAGVITVKSGSRSRLSQDLGLELFGRPGVLATVAAMVLCLALAPGLPKVPFLFVAAGAALLHRWRKRRAVTEQTPQTPSAPDTPRDPLEEAREALRVDRLGLELGFRLVPLADADRNGTLIERIALLRKQVASTWGWLVPTVRVKEDLSLPGDTYRVLLCGEEVARGTLEPGRYLAIGGAGVFEQIEGIPTTEPSFGLPAVWIREDQRAEAELKGYTVADATTVLITHLGEVVKANAADILTRDDVQALLDQLEATAPAVVKELVPGLLSLGELQKVLAALLRERVPLRQLQLILEALADVAAQDKRTDALVEAARQRIARAVVGPLLDEEGKLSVLTLHPQVERKLLEVVRSDPGQVPPDGAFLHGLVEAVGREARRVGAAIANRPPVLVVQVAVRSKLASLLRQTLPDLSVISFAELGAAKKVEALGAVQLEAA